jgi:heme exporter protein A
MDQAAPVLRWSGLTKIFGRQRLFRDLCGELHRGSAMAVVGPNGSGKSTFLRIAAGLSVADRGEMKRPIPEQIGFCSPGLNLYEELTGGENLAFFAELCGIAKQSSVSLLSEVGLEKASDKLFASYSSGMKQRLKLAFALLRSPELLILDEPTIALDHEGVTVVDRIVDNHKLRGGSLLIATNDSSEAERWTDIVLDLAH